MDTQNTAVNAVNEAPAQSPLGPIVQRLKPERVQEELRTLPGWQLAASGEAIERIAASGQVLVTLTAPGGCGLTQAVFDLARHLG